MRKIPIHRWRAAFALALVSTTLAVPAAAGSASAATDPCAAPANPIAL